MVEVIQQLSETEIAYIAGLMDGEGTICMNRTKTRLGDQGARFRARITVAATTSLDLISWLTAKLGIGKYEVGHRNLDRHKQGWAFKPSEKTADALIERCLPYLVIKKRQAELYLRYRAIQRSLYRKGANVRWDPDSMRSLRVIRQWFYEEFRRLNAKGPESVEANTPDLALVERVMKIESDLQGNLQRVSGDAAPPAEVIQ